MSANKKPDLASKVARYLKAKEAGKRAYERSDRLMAEIAKEAKPGEEIVLNVAGRKAVLHDRFAEKDLVWTPCGARRWELKVIEP